MSMDMHMPVNGYERKQRKSAEDKKEEKKNSNQRVKAWRHLR